MKHLQRQLVLLTTVLLTVEETIVALKTASSIAYRPPGK